MFFWEVTLRVSVPGLDVYDSHLVNVMAETIDEAIASARTAVIVEVIEATQGSAVPPP